MLMQSLKIAKLYAMGIILSIKDYLMSTAVSIYS